MTTRTTYNLLRRGIAAMALVCISVITYAQTNVAKIGTTEYATLQDAITAATDGQTITLIADATETATYSIDGKHITIDFADFTISASHNDGSANVFSITSTGGLTLTGTTGGFTDNTVKGIFYNQGTLTVNGGVYSTTLDDYGVIFNEGGTCTIAGGELRGAYSAIYTKGTNSVTVSNGTINGAWLGIQANAGTTLNVTGGTIEATNQAKKLQGIQLKGTGTVANISAGTISGYNGISVLENAQLTVDGTAIISGPNTAIAGNGNPGSGDTHITINGGTLTSDDTGIYHPQIGGTLTINGGSITGAKLGVEIRAGVINVTGGSIKANAAEFSCTPNGSGTTTIGAALAIAQHTTKQDISVSISGGTFTGVKAISESNPQENDPAPHVTMSVTNGTFNGDITTADVKNFISGGTFNQAVAEENCATGFIPKDNGDGTYGVKEGSYVAKIGETKYESMADAIAAAPTATNTTIEILADTITENFDVPAEKIITLSVGEHLISGNITCEGTLHILDGVFTNKPDAAWIAAGHEVMVGAESKYIVAAAGTAEAKIVTVVDEVPTTTLYQTIADAISAAVSTGSVPEITLLKDVAVVVPAEANIKLKVVDDVTLSETITNNGILTITGGAYSGTITNNGTLIITGGTFTQKPNSYTCGDDKDLVINDSGLYVVTDITSAEAEMDGNLYQTIEKAITAAGSGTKTITLRKNPEAETVTIPEFADITLIISNGLTKPITNSGALTIASGSISGAITIADVAATVKIASEVTSLPTVALHADLTTANVLKTSTTKVSGYTSYWVEKKFEAKVGSGITGDELTAAEDLAANPAISAITLSDNQSLTITVTSVTLTDAKVTKATFEVKLIGADGQEITGTVPAFTFRLPVSSTIAADTWVNLWHNTTAIPGASVQASETYRFVNVATTSFSLFSYEIIENPVAQIGETKYATMATAIESVAESLAEPTEISLLADIADAFGIPANKNIKLTIGTHTISGNITNAGTLALADGAISGTITNTHRLTISGTANISGAVSATDGTLTISGGATDAVTTSDAAALTITDGTIEVALTIGGSGANLISGGAISGAVTTSANTTIEGGELTNAISNSAALTITNGTFTGTITNTGTVAISGGTHTVLPVAEFCAAGYMPVKNEDNTTYGMTNSWTIYDDTDLARNSHLSSGDYSVATATYLRNNGMVSAGNAKTQYGTICLPFAITAAPAGMTLYKATAVSNTELTITEVASYPVAVGTPLIFELTAVASSMTVTSSNAAINTTDPTAPEDGNLLVGTYTAVTITEELGSKYYLNGDKFHQAVVSLRVPAYRAYIKYSGGSAPERLSIVKENRVVTSLESAAADEAAIVAVYDLQGRNIGRLQSGINIVRLSNGQTVKIIKK